MEKNRFKCYSAQGALEYLLMIGAAILVVAVVIVALSGIIFDTKDQNTTTDYNNQMEILNDLKKGEDKSTGIFYFIVEQTRGTIVANNISLVLPSDSALDISSINPTINFRGVSVSPTGPQNFTNPVTYTVTGRDGSSIVYTVHILKQAKPLSSDKSILSFGFPSLSLEGSINEIDGTITIIVPKGVNRNLTPSFTISGVSVFPLTGSSIDFSNPVTYTVTAENGSTKDYTIIVTESSDLLPPVITLTSPENNFVTTNLVVDFTFNVTDAESTIKDCELVLNNSTNGVLLTNLSKGTPYTFTRTLSPGSYEWSVNCTDGNMNKGNGVKRIIIISYPPVVFVSSCWNDSISPHPICNCFDLNKIRTHLDWNYYLENDINLNVLECSVFQSGTGFAPLGTDYTEPLVFKGDFNGNKHTIFNLYINLPEADYVGLFGYAKAKIYEIGVMNANITGRKNVGCIAGVLNNSNNVGISLKDSFCTGNITSTFTSDLGGLIGKSYLSEISNSYFSGSVVSNNYYGGYPPSIGGLTGDKSFSSISNSFSTGNVSGSIVGGIVGTLYYARLSNSFTSTVVGGSFKGGIVASYTPTGESVINNSYWDIFKSTAANCYTTIPNTMYTLPAGDNGCVAKNSSNTEPNYFFCPTSPPISSWGEWVLTGKNKYSTTDGQWSICIGSSYPWKSWEKRICSALENTNCIS